MNVEEEKASDDKCNQINIPSCGDEWVDGWISTNNADEELISKCPPNRRKLIGGYKNMG